ncbi:unnamed protein product [Echinostoma caproni]|uniref:Sec16 Sec23-binding domain-containing protein n=1 Tax=Echinostoma caproni TaxID=27848 RepID=A0A3P8FKS4_9TREM|nr:unnamed protein product [Echinostoma caproni]
MVRLLLEGHEPQTSDLRARASNNPSGGNSYTGVSIPNGMLQSTRSYLNESLASLPPSQVPSGRQSPTTGYGIPGTTSSPGLAKAASETGGFGTTQSLLRRAAAAVSGTANSRQLEEDKVLDRFRELLMHGMSMKALEHACRSQLWGHAFVLAQRIGPAVFQKVMDRFLTRAISTSDPILTLYQITAGELPQAVSAAAYGRGSDNGEWRPHLAMILAAESVQPELTQMALERLGDSLLSRRLVYAAHLCYLLMGPLVKHGPSSCTQQPVYQLPEKIVLLGVNLSGSDTAGPTVYGESRASSLNPLNASTEAIQLTEPFKLVYATRLIDAGLLDKAYRYLATIGRDLLLEASRYESSGNRQSVNPLLYSMVGNCLRLIEPLQNHPELDGFELSGPSRVPMSLAGGASGGDFLQQLRDLYDRMNRQVTVTFETISALQSTFVYIPASCIQLARAQYACVMYTVPKPSTDTTGSGDTHMTSEHSSQRQMLQETPGQSGPVQTESHHHPMIPASVNSSVMETSSTAPPVTAYLVPGHRQSTDSQSLGTGRSDIAAPSYPISDPMAYGTPPGEVQNSKPVMSMNPDRMDSTMGFMYNASGSRMSSSTGHISAPQPVGPTTYNMSQPVPSDPHTSFGHHISGSHTDPATGGVAMQNGPVYHSNLFAPPSSSGPQVRDGPSSDGTTAPTGQMPNTTGSESFQPSPNLFFTPMPSGFSETGPDSSTGAGAPGVFDYFAGIRSTEQVHSDVVHR